MNSLLKPMAGILVLAALAPGATRAQDPQAPLTVSVSAQVAAPKASPPQVAAPGAAMTLEQCVQTALGESPVALSAKEAVASARETAAVAKAPYWPTLGFTGGYSRWQRRLFLPDGLFPPGQPVPTIVGPTDDYALSLNAGYLLWDSGERKAQLGAAQARQRMGEAGEQGAREGIVLAVHRAFYGYESAREMRAVAQENLARSEDHVRIAKQRKEVGAVPLSDVLRAQVEAADAKLALVRAESAVRTARGQLATSMGLPVETPLDIITGNADSDRPDEATLAPALDRALQKRSEVKEAQEGVEAARRGVDQANSAWGPKVNAVASYGREDAAWWPQDKTWLAGVTVSIPVFTGFSRVHNVSRAKADLAKAESDARQLDLSVRQQVWDAFSALKEAYESVQASEALVATASESHRLAKERYEVGAGTITDLLDAQASLSRAEASVVSARWACRAAWSQYRWSVGELRP